MAELRGRPIQAGRLEPGYDALCLRLDEVKTHLLDIEGGQAATICMLPGMWTPQPGTRIQLQDPERIAVVRELAYLFDENGFSVSVWLEDPLTRP
jgi:hypothetical protein